MKIRFRPAPAGFHADLKARVDRYFDETGRSRHADASMHAKTAFWLLGAAATYGIVLSNVLPPLGSLAVAMVLGFCLACIGFNVGHDAIHGATSRRGWVNRVFGWSFQLLGAATATWSMMHNFVHHTYTNVPGHDGDIDQGALLRFHDDGPPRFWHRLQHLYAWFLYCFTGLQWVFAKDFMQIAMRDPRTGKRMPASAVASVLGAKVLHGGLFVAAPILLLPLPLWQIAVGYLAMHAVGGFTLAIVFQLAHVVEGPAMPSAPEDGAIDDTWAEHQMRTTANFSRGSAVAQFICGGLNHQIEHHLFPRVCHVHYPAIAAIVEQTAKEYGLPYHEHPTFMAAVRSHARMLKHLGRAPRRAPLAVAPPAPPYPDFEEAAAAE